MPHQPVPLHAEAPVTPEFSDCSEAGLQNDGRSHIDVYFFQRLRRATSDCPLPPLGAGTAPRGTMDARSPGLHSGSDGAS